MARSIIHRTGLNTGRVYNLVGDNLTAYPPGAGNSMVGPWAMDYVSIFGGTLAETGVMWDSEFSGIILDGRALVQGANEDPFIFADLDEDEDLTDRRSRIAENGRGASVGATWVRLYHTSPRWEDAWVWYVEVDGTHAADPEQRLSEWLDEQYQMTGDGLWHSGRHALRVPVRWALYRIPLLDNYESLMDMVSENSLLQTTSGDLFQYGPRGMLTALHGNVWAAQHATRLYEPTDNLRIVERGMFFMPYDGTIRDDDETTPRSGRAPITGVLETSANSTKPHLEGDLSVVLQGGSSGTTFHEFNMALSADGTAAVQRTVPEAFDGSLFPVPTGNTIDLESEDLVQPGTHSLAAVGTAAPSAASRNWGTIRSTVLGTSKRVKARPNELYVWHFHTCPVRLLPRRDPGNDDLIGHYVVGGLSSPFYGPPVRLVYHEGNAL